MNSTVFIKQDSHATDADNYYIKNDTDAFGEKTFQEGRYYYM